MFSTVCISILVLSSLCTACNRETTTRAPVRPTIPTVPTVGPDTAVSVAMRAAGLVPDVLAAPPPAWLTLSFSGAGGPAVAGGAQLSPVQSSTQPYLSWAGAPCEQTAYYTVVMVDPDVPSRATPHWGEARHWLKVNVRACTTGTGTGTGTGTDLDPYVGPGPDQGTNLHRYLLLVYRQPTGAFQDTANLLDTTTRLNFKVQNFANRLQLSLVAGTYFMAEYNKMILTA